MPGEFRSSESPLHCVADHRRCCLRTAVHQPSSVDSRAYSSHSLVRLLGCSTVLQSGSTRAPPRPPRSRTRQPAGPGRRTRKPYPTSPTLGDERRYEVTEPSNGRCARPGMPGCTRSRGGRRAQSGRTWSKTAIRTQPVQHPIADPSSTTNDMVQTHSANGWPGHPRTGGHASGYWITLGEPSSTRRRGPEAMKLAFTHIAFSHADPEPHRQCSAPRRGGPAHGLAWLPHSSTSWRKPSNRELGPLPKSAKGQHPDLSAPFQRLLCSRASHMLKSEAADTRYASASL